MSDKLQHGGRLDAAIARYGGARQNWLDLSTGINPNPWPLAKIDEHVWRDLPDEKLENDCKIAWRQFCGADEDQPLALAPGSQMIIQVLPYLFKPQDVAVVGFTYGEHARCWERAGHSVFVSDGLVSAEATATIIVLVHPNNPDGVMQNREEMIALSRRLAARGGMLIVDEAFADGDTEITTVPHMARDGMAIIE